MILFFYILWITGAILGYGCSIAYFEGCFKYDRTISNLFRYRAYSFLLGIIWGPFSLLFLFFYAERFRYGWKM